jgi:hypothetical protein
MGRTGLGTRAFMKLLATTALGALVFLCAAATVKAEPVDCSSTSFAFSDAAYNVDCERFQDPLRVGQSSGSSITDVMTVSSDDRTIFVTMLTQRITSPRIYMEHRSLGENFRSLFNEDGVKDWRSIGNKDGYDVAEFSREISGHDSRCITMQRYTNPAHVGYKRHVIGMGCTVGALDSLYQILARIDAPGD